MLNLDFGFSSESRLGLLVRIVAFHDNSTASIRGFRFFYADGLDKSFGVVSNVIETFKIRWACIEQSIAIDGPGGERVMSLQYDIPERESSDVTLSCVKVSFASDLNYPCICLQRRNGRKLTSPEKDDHQLEENPDVSMPPQTPADFPGRHFHNIVRSGLRYCCAGQCTYDGTSYVTLQLTCIHWLIKTSHPRYAMGASSPWPPMDFPHGTKRTASEHAPRSGQPLRDLLRSRKTASAIARPTRFRGTSDMRLGHCTTISAPSPL